MDLANLLSSPLPATPFTPLVSLAGGVLIGLSAVLLMAAEGRIAGISGITSRLLPPYSNGAVGGRIAFVAGLLVTPLLFAVLAGVPVAQSVPDALPAMAVAGLLVGFGSVHGGGCTSGHGVCGLARLSSRSLVATATFMAVAMVTVFVTRHLL